MHTTPSPPHHITPHHTKPSSLHHTTPSYSHHTTPHHTKPSSLHHTTPHHAKPSSPHHTTAISLTTSHHSTPSPLPHHITPLTPNPQPHLLNSVGLALSIAHSSGSNACGHHGAQNLLHTCKPLQRKQQICWQCPQSHGRGTSRADTLLRYSLLSLMTLDGRREKGRITFISLTAAQRGDNTVVIQQASTHLTQPVM